MSDKNIDLFHDILLFWDVPVYLKLDIYIYSSSVGIQKYSTFLFLLENPDSWVSAIGDSSLKWAGPVSRPTRGAATLNIVLLSRWDKLKVNTFTHQRLAFYK